MGVEHALNFVRQAIALHAHRPRGGSYKNQPLLLAQDFKGLDR